MKPHEILWNSSKKFGNYQLNQQILVMKYFSKESYEIFQKVLANLQKFRVNFNTRPVANFS